MAGSDAAGASGFGAGGGAAGTDISATEEWSALERHAYELRGLHLRELFDADPDRAERLTTTVGDLLVDWSRQLVTDRTVELLLALADRAGVTGRIAAMLAGEPINATEDRPVLHTALRARPDSTMGAGGAGAVSAGLGAGGSGGAGAGAAGLGAGGVGAVSAGLGAGGSGGVGAVSAVAAELGRMAAFVRALRAGERLGATGRPIGTVVNLGIGGSHLGPAMAHEALAAFRHPGVDCRFVSNVDPADLASTLVGLDPAETLFVVVSKSFTTAETLANARAARAWITAALGPDAVERHFVAVSADPAAAADFGVGPDDVFTMWDWVGGRYSLGSAAGLSLMAAIGDDSFTEMLGGMRAADEHLAARPPAANAPVLMGLLAVWNRNFLGLPARAVLPYSQRLSLLPAYLQQLHMESNGKRVGLDGTPVGFDTGPILWGAAGTGGQHSFHQFLHQGTTVVPADFIVFARPDADAVGLPDADRRHQMLVANCFAQAAALAFGTPPAQPGDALGPHRELPGDPLGDPLGPHRELPGNRPSTVIMAPQITPSVLGQLVALYEHEVLVQGAVWGINSFDQYGVEHGKTLADGIAADLGSDRAGATTSHDPSTTALIARYRRMRNATETA